jgi:phosphoglycerate dehydrogenase-like enzyme
MVSGNVLKVGVAGAGFIGPAHVEALRRLGMQVIGISENTPERCRERASHPHHDAQSLALPAS